MKQFNFNTIKDFDKHIDMSVPNYKHIWELIKSISTNFIKDDTNIYDIGCSTGIGLKNLMLTNNFESAHFIGYEIADNLIKQTSNTTNFTIYNKDITKQETKFDNASFVLSIFTLQFIEHKRRLDVLQKIYNGMNAGGALIVAEKIFCDIGEIQDIFTFSYYDFKSDNFTNYEILGKQHDLRFIMKPLTSTENESLFREAGFKKIDTFFQSLCFKAWILIK
jgi:tRNA (cmo5U34)-methyltransferase